MRPTTLLLLLGLAAITFHGCDEETCPPAQFSVYSPTGGAIYVEVTSDFMDYGFLEVQYGANGFSLGSGTIVTTNIQGTLTGLTEGTYDVYVRGNCGGTDYGQWTGPKSVLVSSGGGGGGNNCQSPSGLNARWLQSSHKYLLEWNYNSTISYYEVEYGTTGFSIGAGTRATLNSFQYDDGIYNQGVTYDFYVRANCGGSNWSNWAGPHSFYAEHTVNQCFAPHSITATKVGSNVHWSIQPNGAPSHEVSASLSPDPNAGMLFEVNTLSGVEPLPPLPGNTLYVYARGVCSPTHRTSWVGPVIINF